MYRGTTPTLYIGIDGIEVKDLTSIYLTLKQGTKELTAREGSIIINEDENQLEVPLTQEETLEFCDGFVEVQLRAISTDGNAIASDIAKVSIDHILKEGQIE